MLKTRDNLLLSVFIAVFILSKCCEENFEKFLTIKGIVEMLKTRCLFMLKLLKTF